MAERNSSCFIKPNDVSSIMAAGRLHMKRNLTLNCRWLGTQIAQAQFPVTYVSSFNLSLLICKFSLYLEQGKNS